VPFRLVKMNGIEGSRPWLLEYIHNHFTRLKLASNMNGIYAQVLDLNAAQRELTLFDGDFTIQAVLTSSAIDNMLRENGVTLGQLQGKRIAIVKLVVLPLLNELPPTLKLILTNIRVFVDSMANRPIQDPPALVNHPRITQVLRTVSLEALSKNVPTFRSSSKRIESNSPPRAVRLEPVPETLPQEPLPEVSDRFRRLSLPAAVVPQTKGAISTPEKQPEQSPDPNNDLELLEGNISPIQGSPREVEVSKSAVSSHQNEGLSPEKPDLEPSKFVADEDNSTLEVDDEDHRNALPELHENLVQRGFLRESSPPPLPSTDNHDIMEDGNTTLVERKHVENEDTGNNVENDDGDQNADVVMSEGNEAGEEGKQKKIKEILPLTQQYDDEEEEDEEEETPAPVKEKEAQRNEIMPMTQHYEDSEEVNEAVESQDGDEPVTQATEGEPLSTLSSDHRMPFATDQPDDGHVSKATPNPEDKVTEVLNITLGDDPVEGAPEEEEKTVELNEAEKNAPNADSSPASRKRQLKDSTKENEVVGNVKRPREGNNEELRVVDVVEENETEGASAKTETRSNKEMGDSEKRGQKKKLLRDNDELNALVGERVDEAMKCFDRFRYELKKGDDIWDYILP